MSDRIVHGEPWTAIARGILRDPRLTAKAKGGLVTILSHDESKVRSIVGILRRENARCGRDEARSILRELVAEGYAHREQKRGKTGKFTTLYTVYSERQVQPPEVVDPPEAVEPATVEPATVNPSLKELEPRELQPLVLGVDLEPQTPNAEGEEPSPQAASTNGKGRNGAPFHLADVLNLGLIVSLRARHPSWRKPLTEGLLTALVRGSEARKITAFGAKAVNAAIDDLYANAATTADPAGYLRERAASHASLVAPERVL